MQESSILYLTHDPRFQHMFFSKAVEAALCKIENRFPGPNTPAEQRPSLDRPGCQQLRQATRGPKRVAGDCNDSKKLTEQGKHDRYFHMKV